MTQVEENLRSASIAAAQPLSAADLQLIAQAREKYEERTAIPCTKCYYCMPCPNGVNIPGDFGFYNHGIMYDDMNTARFRYTRFVSEKERASSCIQCRICEEKCPQGIQISEWMPEVHAVLGENKPPL
jgi:predicted aldo/keto reductase-like oxidoreductase